VASVSISCPSCSATDGVVRNGKSTAGHQRYLCSQGSDAQWNENSR
jgi:transposase-like protein